MQIFMHPLTLVWAILALIGFVMALKNPGRLYMYLSAACAGAAFLAFFDAPLLFQVIMAVLAAITAALLGEGVINHYLVFFIIVDIAYIVLYFLISAVLSK